MKLGIAGISLVAVLNACGGAVGEVEAEGAEPPTSASAQVPVEPAFGARRRRYQSRGASLAGGQDRRRDAGAEVKVHHEGW